MKIGKIVEVMFSQASAHSGVGNIKCIMGRSGGVPLRKIRCGTPPLDIAPGNPSSDIWW